MRRTFLSQNPGMWSWPGRLAPKGELLDPRPEPIAAGAPLARAVNIPADQLSARLSELPPRHETVRVADIPEFGSTAISVLQAGDRKAELVPSVPARRALGPYRLWQPNPFLMSRLREVAPGRALDLGCGSGREAVALAGHEFRVTACDWLPDALDLGRLLASRYLRVDTIDAIHWLERDLEAEGPPDGRFDLIVVFRFLDRGLFGRLGDFLASGGHFIAETFTERHRERHGKPRTASFVLRTGELPTLTPEWEILTFDEGWRGDGSHTARIHARKP